MNIHIIWAQDNNAGIGKNNQLPWHISEDLMNFKKITLNNVIIMGRKTWESLPKKPLPNRRNIVLSSNKLEDVESYPSIDSCIAILKKNNIPDIFVIGGEMVYKNFFQYANILHITFINQTIESIDTYFPVKMDEIKQCYTMIEKTTLTAKCIYTKWVKI